MAAKPENAYKFLEHLQANVKLHRSCEGNKIFSNSCPLLRREKGIIKINDYNDTIQINVCRLCDSFSDLLLQISLFSLTLEILRKFHLLNKYPKATFYTSTFPLLMDIELDLGW